MSKMVSCREVGVDCDFEARGETEQEVLQKCAEHAKSAQGTDEIPADLAAKVRASIRDDQPQQTASRAT
jgi:predicted small metal-binding protein